MYTCPLAQPPPLPSSLLPFLSCKWTRCIALEKEKLNKCIRFEILTNISSNLREEQPVLFPAFWVGQIFFFLALEMNKVLKICEKPPISISRFPAFLLLLSVLPLQCVQPFHSVQMLDWSKRSRLYSAQAGRICDFSIIMVINIATFLCAQPSWLSHRPTLRAVPWPRPVMRSFSLIF